VDAVEAANGGNSDPSYDALAWVYAKKAKLPVTAGTDIHSVVDARPDTVFGVYLDKKMVHIADYVEAIRNKAVGVLKIPPGRCDLRGNEQVMLPVDIRDRKDRSTGKDLWEFLGI
jgi:hypothetical protein